MFDGRIEGVTVRREFDVWNREVNYKQIFKRNKNKIEKIKESILSTENAKYLK